MATIGFIGVGNMASAIIGGITKTGIVKASEIMLFDPHSAKADQFAKEGMRRVPSASELVKNCRYVVLSVKPQVCREVLKEIAPACREENVFVSIAAGIGAKYIKDTLGYDAKVVLVMPNTPLLVGHGASALSRVEPTTEEEFAYAMELFASAGEVAQIAPDKMNEVIPVNGSSPAAVYRIAQIFVKRAVSCGLKEEVANKLFCATLIGCAHMMLETGKSHQELIDMVTSPGGTTFRLMEAMEAGNIEGVLNEGIDQCIERAYELGR